MLNLLMFFFFFFLFSFSFNDRNHVHRNLQLEYLDLFLIHWPLRLSPGVWEFPTPKQHILLIDMKSVWEGMEECRNLSLTKAIGVSNFSPKKLEEILSFAKIPPAVNQVTPFVPPIKYYIYLQLLIGF